MPTIWTSQTSHLYPTVQDRALPAQHSRHLKKAAIKLTMGSVPSIQPSPQWFILLCRSKNFFCISSLHFAHFTCQEEEQKNHFHQIKSLCTEITHNHHTKIWWRWWSALDFWVSKPTF